MKRLTLIEFITMYTNDKTKFNIYAESKGYDGHRYCVCEKMRSEFIRNGDIDEKYHEYEVDSIEDSSNGYPTIEISEI